LFEGIIVLQEIPALWGYCFTEPNFVVEEVTLLIAIPEDSGLLLGQKARILTGFS
jgi:hypothetical protein